MKSHVSCIIREHCKNCSNFSESFLCHGNPTTPTYRTTLVNPFHTNFINSSHLVDIIQNWISTTPSFTIDWLLMRVNPSCTTEIPSLDVPECTAATIFPDSAVVESVSRVLNVCAVRELGTSICNV